MNRKLRIARNTIWHHARRMAAAAGNPAKQARLIAFYERACARVAASRLNPNDK